MWIHERENWSEFSWDIVRIAKGLMKIEYKLGILTGQLQGIDDEYRRKILLEMYTDEIIHSSAIEGEHLDREVVMNTVVTYSKRTEEEIEEKEERKGLEEGIARITVEAREGKNFGEEELKRWHRILFEGVEKEGKITVGDWRKGGVKVVSNAIGKEKEHYVAPDASMVADEMRKLICWISDEVEIHPILKAGIAHFWFVTIHPFDDGNGRLGRIISDMIITRVHESNYYYSVSKQLELERKDYYRHLESQQRMVETSDITGWLEWFLEIVCDAIEVATKRYRNYLVLSKISIRFSLNDRQRRVLNLMMDGFQGKMSTSKYAKIMKCSDDTALRDINFLLECGVLRRSSSGGRSSSYHLASLVLDQIM